MKTAIAEVFPAGEHLADELEARGWTQAEFAEILDRPAQFVSEIISGKKEITRESAAQIGAALGTSAEMWLKLQDDYYLSKQRQDASAQSGLDEVRRRGRLNGKGPISLLRKRGVLTGATLDELEAEVCQLFELESLDDEPALRLAAKRANHGEALSALQTAWAYCVRREARLQGNPANSYSREALDELAASLPGRLTSPEAFRELPELLGNVGVRLVHVEALPGAKIDGCAMLVDDVPVIGLSGRGRRLDKVLFTLLHEIAHLSKGHVDAEHAIVEEVEGQTRANPESESTEEGQANALATHWIVPNDLGPLPERVTGSWLEATAARLHIAPIVLVGQLQHRGRLDWRSSHVKGAPTVNESLESW